MHYFSLSLYRLNMARVEWLQLVRMRWLTTAQRGLNAVKVQTAEVTAQLFKKKLLQKRSLLNSIDVDETKSP